MISNRVGNEPGGNCNEMVGVESRQELIETVKSQTQTRMNKAYRCEDIVH
uniref:Uncharacterized protein n=1 Tax=Arion vulgaris TaxID=1028688 RepID=A0A0B7BIL2_9EUPU